MYSCYQTLATEELHHAWKEVHSLVPAISGAPSIWLDFKAPFAEPPPVLLPPKPEAGPEPQYEPPGELLDLPAYKPPIPQVPRDLKALPSCFVCCQLCIVAGVVLLRLQAFAFRDCMSALEAHLSLETLSERTLNSGLIKWVSFKLRPEWKPLTYAGIPRLALTPAVLPHYICDRAQECMDHPCITATSSKYLDSPAWRKSSNSDTTCAVAQNLLIDN